MTIPDKLVSSCSWEEINIYIFVKRSKANVSLADIAKEFGLPRTSVFRKMKKLQNFGLSGTVSGTPNGTASGTTSGTLKPLTDSDLNGAVGTPNGTVSGTTSGTASGTLESRKKEFYNSLIPYVKKYGKDTVRAFYDYWSETKGKNGKKMKCDMEKTFEIPYRLAKWNDYNYTKRNHSDTGVVFRGNSDDDYNDYPNT